VCGVQAEIWQKRVEGPHIDDIASSSSSECWDGGGRALGALWVVLRPTLRRVDGSSSRWFPIILARAYYQASQAIVSCYMVGMVGVWGV
jgi:hypothetical protein